MASLYELIPGSAIISSGLSAERVRMEVCANNMANAQSTGPDGAYKRRIPVFQAVYSDMNSNSASDLGGVKVTEIAKDESPGVKVYSPYSPYADQDGMVEMPNFSPIMEMMDLISSTRAYEANLSVMKQAFDSAQKTINMGK
jgi:flagellar basal-body rod protein FlgC